MPELETATDQLSQPPVANPVVQKQPAQPDPASPETQPAQTGVAGVLGKLFKRNGRHPKDCQCPLHKKAEGNSRFDPPVVSDEVSDPQPLDPPPVPANPARFAMWGRLVSRTVKAGFRFLTAETPAKARKLFGEVEGSALVSDLVITDAELADLEGSATRLAEKYQLTTGIDDEIEFGVTLATIFGRVIAVNKKLDKALKALEQPPQHGA